jgi:hypothetical protein
MSNIKNNTVIVLILVLAFVTRLLMAVFFYSNAGDTGTYEIFAQNIYRGCGMSYSDPNSSLCELTSGGYFPGYPVFVASIWKLMGTKSTWVLIGQIVSYVIALFLLLRSINYLTQNQKIVIIVGIFMALSPLQIGWYRFLITEPLAISLSIWFVSELVLSLALKKIRVFSLSVAMVLSVYVRPDTILMFVGIIPIAFYLHAPKQAFLKLFMIIFLSTIPISGWMIRNVSVGDSPITKQVDYYPKSPGYIKWWKTWVVNEYQRADIFFPLWPNCGFCYSQIKVHDSRYINAEEMESVLKLINELKQYEGEPFPQIIDDQFNDLYIQKSKNQSFLLSAYINLERAFFLTLNPFSSWGLPLETREINRKKILDALTNKDIEYLAGAVEENWSPIIGKIFVFAYRLLLMACIVFILCKIIILQKNSTSSVDSNINILMLSSTLYFFTRLIFFIYLVNLESRYLIEALVWLEVSVIIWILCYCKKFNAEIGSYS